MNNYINTALQVSPFSTKKIMTPLLVPLLLGTVFRKSLAQVATGEPEVCTVRAWVRAEDLSPSHISRGELRIKVLREECANQIASVTLRLQLDEFGEVKFLKSGAVLPEILPANQTAPVGPADWMGSNVVYDYQAHDDGLSDPELWTVKAEERRAWMTEATLLDNHPDLTQPIVTPFTIAVPAVNYPPVAVQHRQVHGPISRHSFSVLAYRYIAVVKFTDGRTENVLAGHTAFVPASEDDIQGIVPFTQRTVFEESKRTRLDDPASRKRTEEPERCLPESQRSTFFAEISLEDGKVVHKGQALKGRVTVHSLKAGLTIMSGISVSLRSRQRNDWAKTQARTGGDRDFLNATSGQFSKSDVHRVLDTESDDSLFIFDEIYPEIKEGYSMVWRSSPKRSVSSPITSTNPSFDFELQIPHDAPLDFASYYGTIENQLDLRLTVLYPPEVAKCIGSHSRGLQTEEEPTIDNAKMEEGMWDSHTRVGQPVQSRSKGRRSMDLQASVAITVFPPRATATPIHPVAHYLKRGVEALGPVLRSGREAEMPDSFPVAQPVFAVEALANTSARLLRAGSTDPSLFREQFRNRTRRQFPDPTKNYFSGNFAGLLWRKKMVAEERGILPFVESKVVDGEDLHGQQPFPVAT
ncbi:hypothetical protein C8R45DRAFT_1222247 [Mycena sanguinolenta]|nr:hypothetical protein C8R45DRAFT_1222247 [Mycena sanguinolenta]